MAAKFDKEMMKKHHFWLLFAPLALFILIAWYALLADVPDVISAKMEDNEKKKKQLAANVKAQPRKTIDEYGKQVGTLDDQRGKLWKEGWNHQKDLYTWPKGYTDEQRAVVANMKFGEEIPEKVGSVRDQFRAENVYANEYKNLVQTLEPMQFRESWDTLLQYVRVWGNVPSSEDIWLAMEDYWIQRELLLAIHQVNVNAAAFTLDDKSKDTPTNRTFRSRFWEVNLQLIDYKGKQTLKGKLKNISGRLQVMGIGNTMKLEVVLSGRTFIFDVQGDPVEADAEYDVKTILKHTIPPDWKSTSIDSVRQVFDARTVPIKRVDFVKLYKPGLSDRNKDLTMKMAKFSEEVAKKEAPVDGGTVGGEGTVPMNPSQPGLPTATPAAKTLPPLSQNKLERYRYIEATEQIRRMPFGIVIVGDQSFMKDITEQLLKLSLRLQITQVDWIRFHGSLNYNQPGSTGGGPPRSGMGEGGFRGLDGLPSSGPSNSREDQFSANLMELTIYGIASMYERFPDEKQTVKSPAKK